ncbi:M20/M25/M40 family metallo-hydrolase [Streptomyces sp. NPDC007920]|uniref:M20/M25/M40 family metallo-hydrolase n=1 Tax=Streptomyces sp. NPDC007920 TaxID=3364794 RepID=UPI0036E5D98F
MAAATRRAATHPADTDVQLVFTLGEETGCEGAARLNGPAASPLLLVAEPTANRIVLGHKGALWLRLTAEGRSAHGSRPELGDNALARLAAAAVRIHDHQHWPHSATHGPATVNVGTFHAGVQPNLVPDHAELMLDIRTVPEFTSEDALAAIEGLAGPGTRIERVLDLNGVATDPDEALVRGVFDALRPAAPDGQPQYATYFTDASVLAWKLDSPPVVIYGPGEPEQAHVTDERLLHSRHLRSDRGRPPAARVLGWRALLRSSAHFERRVGGPGGDTVGRPEGTGPAGMSGRVRRQDTVAGRAASQSVRIRLTSAGRSCWIQ